MSQYKVYIQQIKTTINGKEELQFPDDWVFAAYLGFNKLGMDIVFFENILEVPKSKFHIVVSFVEDTKVFFNRMQIRVPRSINIPSDLPEKYIDRKYFITSLGKLKEMNLQGSWFVKPAYKFKIGASGVLSDLSKKSLNLILNDVNDKEMMLVSEVVDFISEYRCFVHHKKLIGIQNYMGDFTMFPDINIIEGILNDFKTSIVAYTIDVGVTKEGKTLLIEIQDAWSIGNYGLEGKTYAKFLRDRWIQIMNENKYLELEIKDLIGKTFEEAQIICEENGYYIRDSTNSSAGGADLSSKRFNVYKFKDDKIFSLSNG